MAAQTYLHRRSSGTYAYRRRVPTPLVAIVGKEVLWCSLDTKVLNEAKRRATAKNLEVEATLIQPAEKALEWGCGLEEARDRMCREGAKGVAVSPTHLSGSDLKNWGEWLSATILQADEANRREGFGKAVGTALEAVHDIGKPEALRIPMPPREAERPRMGMSVKEAATYHEIIGFALEKEREAAGRGDASAHLDEAKAIAQRATGGDDSNDEVIRELARRIQHARLIALDGILKRGAGQVVPTPAITDPLVNRYTLREALDDWRKRPSPPRERTLMEAEEAAKRFGELHGNVPVREITSRQVREFRDALLVVPTRLSKQERKLSLPALAALGRGDPDRPRPNPNSVAKKLRMLQAPINDAAKEERLGPPEAWRDPFAGLTADDPEEDNGKDSFTSDEITALFQALRDDADTSGRQFGPARHMIPLMMLWSGCRPAEVGQLRVKDVLQDGDRWFFSVNREDGRRVKTRSSIRHVPIHRRLVELGLIAHVEAVKEDRGANAALFREAMTGADGRDPIAPFIQWMSRFLRGTVKITDERKSFYSLRHSFAASCRLAEIDEETREAIMGHMNDGRVSRRYGRSGNSALPHAILSRAIDKIEYNSSRIPDEWQ